MKINLEKIKSFFDENQILFGSCKTEDIVFREEFVEKCAENYCGMYKKKWCCPPAIKDVDYYKKEILKYRNVLTFSTISELDDHYDVINMNKARNFLMHKAYQLKNMLNKSDFNFLMFGSGSCELCEECTYPDAPCRYPDLMLIPLEALGIDVYNLGKKCGLKYYNGELTVTYFCALVY